MDDLSAFVRDRIQMLRSNKGVSARDMSLTIGQGHTYITQIENGAHLPSLEGLTYICEYFGISLSEFFDEGIKHPDEVSKLVKECRTLDRTLIEHFTGIAKQFNKK